MNLFKNIKGFINSQFSIGLKDNKIDIRSNNGVLEVKNKGNDFRPITTLTDWKENQLYTQSIDIVLINNKFYRCSVTHTSTTTFNPSYWTLINDLTASSIQTWNSNTDYLKETIVLFGNNLYSALENHNSGTIFDSTKWSQLGVGNGGGLKRIDHLANSDIRTTNQTIFEAPDHAVNSSALIVLVEGITKIKGVDYNDLDSTHIKFINEIPPSESVSIILIDVSGLTGVMIDDTVVAIDKTWSSGKLDTEFNDIKSQLEVITYKPITINSFINNINVVEVGSTITSVTFNWNLSKTPITQSINGGVGSLVNDLRTYNLTGQNITSDTDFTLAVSDGKTTVNASTGIYFRNRRYWGVNPNASIDETAIKAMSSDFVDSYTQNRTFNCTGGNYIYICFPATFTGTPTFTSGGFTFPMTELSQVSVTNSNGHTSNYRVFRSVNLMNSSEVSIVIT